MNLDEILKLNKEMRQLLNCNQILHEFACMNNPRTDIHGTWEDRWKKLLMTGKEGDYLSNIAKNNNIKGKRVNLVLGNDEHGFIHFIKEHMWEKFNGELVNFKDLINNIPKIIQEGTPKDKMAKSTEGIPYVRIQTIEGKVNGISCEIAIETHKERSLAEAPVPTPWIISAYYKNCDKMSKQEIANYRDENYYGCTDEEILLNLQ